MKELLNRICKLLAIKSVVTIILSVLFFILAKDGKIDGEQVLLVYTTVISFYFGTQLEKNNKEKNE